MSKKTHHMSKERIRFLLLVAIAIVFSFIKIPIMIQGGSVTIDYLVLFIIIINYNKRQYLYAVLLYSIFQLMFAGYFFTLIQWLLDYPIAIFSLGIMTYIHKPQSFKGQILLIIVGFIFNYICHVVSGYLFFGNFAPEGISVLGYTLVYNFIYWLPSVVITLIGFITLYKRDYLNMRDKR